MIDAVQSGRADLDRTARTPRRGGISPGKHGQPDRPDRRGRRVAAPRWQGDPPAVVRAARSRRSSTRGWPSTATASCRELHGSSRSHIYLAVDTETEELVVIKTPSVDLQGDPVYLERFLLEEWVARRINSAHVLKPCRQTRQREYLYVATEYIDGQTLSQWMIDNPRPDVETRARHRGADRQGAPGLSPARDAASGREAGQRHDRHAPAR